MSVITNAVVVITFEDTSPGHDGDHREVRVDVVEACRAACLDDAFSPPIPSRRLNGGQ